MSDKIETVRLQAPFSERVARELKSGQRVLLSGVIYSLRDAGHKRLVELLKRGEEPPFPIENAVLYYVGPSPAKAGRALGSAGPTTSSRMDPYTSCLIRNGLRGMIGKGYRSDEVINAMKKHGAVYFAAIGGAGALLSQAIKEAKVIAWDDLGTEALRRLMVEDMPVTVAIDTKGVDLYKEGPDMWLKRHHD
ncbi:MAG TPA: Fe-S-containing hydro-lyase [Clostridiaceae bacterium]|nr:Fe-S-containing hydro-lyase [Clostridiaceae bacterium]